MYPNTVRKVELFLDYQSCGQGSLKKLNGGIFLHYFTYKLEACEIQSWLWMKWWLPPPSFSDGSMECKHSELDEIVYESATVYNQGLRVCKCNEFWGEGGSDRPENTTFKDDEFTVVHFQHWHMTPGGCPENVMPKHISEDEFEVWDNLHRWSSLHLEHLHALLSTCE